MPSTVATIAPSTPSHCLAAGDYHYDRAVTVNGFLGQRRRQAAYEKVMAKKAKG